MVSNETHDPLADLISRFTAAEMGVPHPGLRVGNYALIEEVGRGGMGSVWSAERADGRFSARVAIKLIRRDLDSDELIRRFNAERAILGRLQHPGIARLLDAGITEAGRPFLVMEYCAGEPLTRYCDRIGADIPTRLRLFGEVCEAVRYAHRNLVIHRDIKPGNIVVTEEGRVVLLDFGIARLAEREDAETATVTRLGARLMTPEYAAPEQLRGEPLTTACDVFALGLVLRELISGQRPERATETPRGDLGAIIETACNPEPERRYDSVERLAEDCERFVGGYPVRARRDHLFYRLGKLAIRHKGTLAAACLIGLALITGLLTTLWQARVAARERDLAREEAAKFRHINTFLVDVFEDANPDHGSETVSARELLDRAASRLSLDEVETAWRSELAWTMGRAYHGLGLDERAHALLSQALAEAPARCFGALSFDLALVALDLGRIEEAHELLKRARIALERDDPILPELETLLAFSHERLGETDVAEHHYAEARRLLSRQDRDLPPRWHNRMARLLADSEHGLAERHLRDQLAALDPQTHLAGATHAALGQHYLDTGRADRAEHHLTRGLAVLTQTIGADHPETREVRRHLGTLYYRQNRMVLAHPLLTRETEHYGDLLRRESRDYAMSLFELGYSNYRLGNFTDAEDSFRKALVLDSLAPSVTRRLLADLAAVVRAMGRTDEGQAFYRRALELGDETALGDAETLARITGGLGEIALNNGDPERARRFLERAIALYETSGAITEQVYPMALSNYGEVLVRAGEIPAGLDYLRRAHLALDALNGPFHPTTVQTAVRLREAEAASETDAASVAEPTARIDPVFQDQALTGVDDLVSTVAVDAATGLGEELDQQVGLSRRAGEADNADLTGRLGRSAETIATGGDRR